MKLGSLFYYNGLIDYSYKQISNIVYIFMVNQCIGTIKISYDLTIKIYGEPVSSIKACIHYIEKNNLRGGIKLHSSNISLEHINKTILSGCTKHLIYYYVGPYSFNKNFKKIMAYLFEIFDTDVYSKKPVKWQSKHIFNNNGNDIEPKGKYNQNGEHMGLMHYGRVYDSKGNSNMLMLTILDFDKIDNLIAQYTVVAVDFGKYVSAKNSDPRAKVSFDLTGTGNEIEMLNIIKSEAIRKIQQEKWNPHAVIFHLAMDDIKLAHRRLSLYKKMADKDGHKIGCSYNREIITPNFMGLLLAKGPISDQIVQYLTTTIGKRN